jgi:hypothetical protein
MIVQDDLCLIIIVVMTTTLVNFLKNLLDDYISFIWHRCLSNTTSVLRIVDVFVIVVRNISQKHRRVYVVAQLVEALRRMVAVSILEGTIRIFHILRFRSG